MSLALQRIRAVDDFAQREIEFVTAIGGIGIKYGKAFGRNVTLKELQSEHDAVFLGMGLAGVNGLALKSADHKSVRDAVEFIAALRQAKNKTRVPVGRNIVVIGGGMTAIDAAVQAKLLGAETVTICYRRGQESMNASRYEQELAATRGVNIRTSMQPKKLLISSGELTGVELEYTSTSKGKLSGTGQTVKLAADQVLLAIGQKLAADGLGGGNGIVEMAGGRIKTDGDGHTTIAGVWAGGDCTNSGDDLTVTGVAQGRDAAESIHTWLSE